MGFIDTFRHRIVKSKSSLDKIVENYQKDMAKRGIYSLTFSKEFMNKFARCPQDYKKELFETYSCWDMVNPISIETGTYLEQLFTQNNYAIGVHRSSMINGSNLFEDEVLDSIINRGLVVLGDASSGSIRVNADPNKTLTFGGSLLVSMINLKGKYKGSSSAIIAAIPSQFVNEEGELIKGHEADVYDYIDGSSYLKPEYIINVMVQTFTNEICPMYTINQIKEHKQTVLR